MWLVNKTFKFISELVKESPRSKGVATFSQKGYEKLFIPTYESYEEAVGDFPYENIIKVNL